jgi:hypothetical protein
VDGASVGATEAASEGAADGEAPALLQAATTIAIRPVDRMVARRTWITSVLSWNGRECTGEAA